MVGCGRGPEGPTAPDTGAREAARGFYRAIIAKDWARAYAALDPDSRRNLSPEQFTRRADAYRKYLTFDPTTIRIPICEERGTGATARIELTGSGAGKRTFKDAVMLRKRDDRWFIDLPVGFGQPP